MAKTKLLQPDELSERDLDRWRDLEQRALSPNPFQVAGFLAPALRHISNGTVALCVTQDSDGKWLGCMPIHSSRGWHRMPLLGGAMWDHAYNYLGVPLLDGSRSERALADLLRSAARGSFFGLDLIPTEGMFRECLDSVTRDMGMRTVIFDRFERAALRRKDGNLILPFKKKRRYEMNRLQRRLSEHLSAPVELYNHNQDRDCLEDFLRLEAAGWKGKQGTALACKPSHAAFFHAIAEHFIETGAWQLYSLEADGKRLAMLTAIVSDHTLYGFKIAFDEDYAQYSPGVLLHRATMRLLDEEGEVMLVDTCAYPTNETANRLYPDRIALETVALPADGVRGLYSAPTLRLAATLKQRRQAVRKEQS